jgi:hypothetical protein
MYARRATRPKPRSAQTKSWAAPIGGWVSNRNLANPNAPGAEQGAAILDNFYPKASSVILRRGKQLYATLGDGTLDAMSLFTYMNGANERLFGATATTIYDLTNVLTPAGYEITTEANNPIVTEINQHFGEGSTDSFVASAGYTGGEWNTVQFATTGGTYLTGVNGQDDGFIFDGNAFYPNVSGGVTRLNYDARTVPFTVGSVVTGATSGAKGTVIRVTETAPGIGQLWLRDVTGAPFLNDEALTATGGGAATADGASVFVSPGVKFGTGDVTSADMAFVWIYKERLWFVERDSQNAWYLDPDSIGGTAKIFPLAGIFGKGGSLLFGQTWSLEAGANGGLSEQCIFVSSEGEVAIYQGINPDEAETWSKVGLYRIGTPLGRRAFFRGGGDLAISTSVGLVPLSKAIGLDVTSLSVATVSYRIADAWHDAVTQRGLNDWQAQLWPEERMAVISPPNLIGADQPVLFISNSETGAWARYTNWHALCMAVFRGQLYFGSPNGQVFIANVSGLDGTEAYSGTILPLFEDLDSAMSAKVGKMARAVVRANVTINDRVDMRTDYSVSAFPPPDASVQTQDNTWGTAVWGQATWGAVTPTVMSQEWRSVSGIGYSVAVSFQVTSGALTPIDAELIRLDLAYTPAEIIT